MIYLDCYALGWANFPSMSKSSVTLKIEDWPDDAKPKEGEPEPTLEENTDQYKGWRTSWQDPNNKEEKREKFLQLKHSTRPKACDRLAESNPHRSMAEKIASAGKHADPSGPHQTLQGGQAADGCEAPQAHHSQNRMSCCLA